MYASHIHSKSTHSHILVFHACISLTALNAHGLPRVTVILRYEGTLENVTLTATALKIVHSNGRANAVPVGQARHWSTCRSCGSPVARRGQHARLYIRLLTAYTVHSTLVNASLHTLHCILTVYTVYSTLVNASLHTLHCILTVYTVHSTLVNASLHTRHSSPCRRFMASCPVCPLHTLKHWNSLKLQVNSNGA